MHCQFDCQFYISLMLFDVLPARGSWLTREVTMGDSGEGEHEPSRKKARIGQLRYAPPVAAPKVQTRAPAAVQPPAMPLGSLHEASSSASSSSCPAPGTASSSFGPKNVGQEKFREVAKQFFLSNKLSAIDCAKLARGGRNSGATDVDDLARSGASGRHPQNAARDIMAKLLKETDMPPLFWHEVKLWDPNALQPCVESVPFLLPHQVLGKVGHKWNLMALSKERAPQIWEQFAAQCIKLGLDVSKTVPLGLHGDGVPYTKHQSLEMISWNILGDATGDRVPFTGISKRYTCKCGCLGRCTWDSVLEVFAWSMRALCQGQHPSVGPGGSVLQDAYTVSMVGTSMPQAVLCQIRGDWPFLKALFSVPVWNTPNICWQCPADRSGGPCDYRNVGLQAAWRQTRLGTTGFLATLHAQGIAPSPLFGAPGLLMEHVVLDWLHIVDLGISQDLMGNFFHKLVLDGGLPGSNKKQRLQVLWTKLREFYKENKSPSRLGELTLEMFERARKAPKLRSKGGESRHLVPFCAALSKELSHKNDEWKCMSNLFHYLLECAKHAAAVPFVPEDLSRDSRKVCLLWKSLRDKAEASGDTTSWTMKPKVHLFQELCEYKASLFGSPELFWTYMDESFCGFLALAAKRRGGRVAAAVVPDRLLSRYRAMRG